MGTDNVPDPRRRAARRCPLGAKGGTGPKPGGFQLGHVLFLVPGSSEGLALIDRMVSGQATIISYQNDFLMIVIMGLCSLPLLLLFRSQNAAPPVPAMAAAD
jgi:hypothetical protein